MPAVQIRLRTAYTANLTNAALCVANDTMTHGHCLLSCVPKNANDTTAKRCSRLIYSLVC